MGIVEGFDLARSQKHTEPATLLHELTELVPLLVLQRRDVDQADDKKKVTLEEILTMTSGLVTACSAEGEDPQTTLQEVLNLVDSEVDQTGEWNYLALECPQNTEKKFRSKFLPKFR